MTKSSKITLCVLLLIIYHNILGLYWIDLIRFLNCGYITQMVLSQVFMFILPAAVYFLISRENIIETLKLKPLAFKNIILILIISIFIQPFMSLLSFITMLFFPNNVSELMDALDFIPLYQMVIAIGVAPAICEEIFFRGVVFSGYKNVTPVKACLMTGLLFGIMHMDGQQFLYAFAMGSVFCYFVYETGSIFASMLSHFFINSSQVALGRILSILASYSEEAVTSEIPDITYSVFSQFISLSIAVAVVAPIVIVCFWALHEVNKNSKKTVLSTNTEIFNDYFEVTQQKKERVINIPFILILIIYVCVIAYPYF